MLGVGRHLAVKGRVVRLLPSRVRQPVDEGGVVRDRAGVLERGERLQPEELGPRDVVLVVGEEDGFGQVGAAQGLRQVQIVPVRGHPRGPVVAVLRGLRVLAHHVRLLAVLVRENVESLRLVGDDVT